MVSDDLSWSSHYHNISSRAYIQISWPAQAHLLQIQLHPLYMKKVLYMTWVRSQLLYCSPVWRPYLVKDFKSLERIQRRATKFILNNYTSDYKHRLVTHHNIFPLSVIYELNDILLFIRSLKDPSSGIHMTDFFLLLTLVKDLPMLSNLSIPA